MRRISSCITRPVDVCAPLYMLRNVSGLSPNGTPAISQNNKRHQAGNSFFAPAATVFNVPCVSSKFIGRDSDLTRLWQKTLGGSRIHVIAGPDGLGKSSLAARFCERCLESSRFSCIQWLDGRHSVSEQIESVVLQMRGRGEQEILLVIDDVADPSVVLSKLPKHEKCHYVITTSVRTADSGNTSQVLDDTHIHRVTISPLPSSTSAQLVENEVSDPQLALRIAVTFAHVPLLIEIASKLISSNAAKPSEVFQCSDKAVTDGCFSVSRCVEHLVKIAKRALESKISSSEARDNVVEALGALSCFNSGDINPSTVDALGAEAVVEYSQQLGLIKNTWCDSESVAIQPLVAKVLRRAGGVNSALKAAESLQRLWPRRMGGGGSTVCSILVLHSISVHSSFIELGAPLSDSLIVSLDKAANYLAMAEGKDLGIAANLWLAVHNHSVAKGDVSEASVRVARDLGKILYKLHRYTESEEVLRKALAWSEALVGSSDTSHALLVACYAPFLPSNTDSLSILEVAVRVLTCSLASGDAVYSVEERRMMTESHLVLLLCNAQTLVDTRSPVPDELRSEISRLERTLASR